MLDSLATYDLVIVGPGPGDPRDGDDPKMQRIRAAVDRLLENQRPFLAVCLGHQTLCHRLGIGLHFKDIVFQGTQSPVEIDGRVERVGFYNTFVGRVPIARATRPATEDRPPTSPSRPTPSPATSTCSPGRTTRASSSTPSRS